MDQLGETPVPSRVAAANPLWACQAYKDLVG